MKYLKICFLTCVKLIIFITILSVLYYYDIINNRIFNIFKIVLFIIIFIINGYKLERISSRKYYNNIIFCSFISLTLILINLVYSKISFRLLIYILIIISSNFLGSFMFKKRKKRS